jgi:hypothetical protein
MISKYQRFFLIMTPAIAARFTGPPAGTMQRGLLPPIFNGDQGQVNWAVWEMAPGVHTLQAGAA